MQEKDPIEITDSDLLTLKLNLVALSIQLDMTSPLEQIFERFGSSINTGKFALFIKDQTWQLAMTNLLIYHGFQPQFVAQLLKAQIKPLHLTAKRDVRIIGLIPFDPITTESQLTIPTITIQGDSHSITITSVAHSQQACQELIDETVDSLNATATKHLEQSTRNHDFPLEYQQQDDTWLETTANAIDQIRNGAFEKIVLSRRARSIHNSDLSRISSIKKLLATYPGTLVFSYFQLLGASPELLIKRQANNLLSHPLAGTSKRENVLDLINSEKNLHEHELVTSFITKHLAQFCESIEVPQKPSVIYFDTICHLSTQISAKLMTSEGSDSLTLLLAIHPTPAVAGVPQRAAIEFIQTHEPEPRIYYAGAVGFQDLDDDGEWHLIIRTVALMKDYIEYQAGVGLVAESNPLFEKQELTAKIDSMHNVI